MDFQALLLNPAYSAFGVPATLTVACGNPAVAVTVIDKTAGVVFSEGPDVQTVRPAADLRMSDLTAAGLTRADLDDGMIEFNGAAWTIKATLPKPTPNGESDGELRLILMAQS